MKKRGNNKRKSKKLNNNNKGLRIYRNDPIVAEACNKNVTLKCIADIAEHGSHRNHYRNILLENIKFQYKGHVYYVEHCWLQQKDYPAVWYDTTSVGDRFELEFSFYAYTDATDRGMHGMTINSYRRLFF